MDKSKATCSSCSHNLERAEKLVEVLSKISKSIDTFENLLKESEDPASSSCFLISNVRSILKRSEVDLQTVVKVKVKQQQQQLQQQPEPSTVNQHNSTNFSIQLEEQDPLSLLSDPVKIEEAEEITDRCPNVINFGGTGATAACLPAYSQLDNNVEYHYETRGDGHEMMKFELTEEEEEIITLSSDEDEDLSRTLVSSSSSICTPSSSLSRERTNNGGRRKDEKPQGPKTSYSYFVQERWRKFDPSPDDQTVKNPTFKAFSQQCAGLWNRMTNEEKHKYREMAHGDARRYEAEMNDYRSPNAPNGKKKPKRRYDSRNPKRALTAFFWFCCDERPAARAWLGPKNCTIPQVSRELSRRWSMASEEVRNKYKQISALDKIRYEQEAKAFRGERRK